MDNLDNPSYNWWQSLLIIIFVIGVIGWLISDDVEEAGLIDSSESVVVGEQLLDDPQDIHYLLITVGKNQAVADDAYQQGLNAVKLFDRQALSKAIDEVDRGVVRMAFAKEKKTETIAHPSAKRNMKRGLYLLWKINTTRRNYLQEISDALENEGLTKSIQRILNKYDDSLVSLEDLGMEAVFLFMQAKVDVGLPQNLSEFVKEGDK